MKASQGKPIVDSITVEIVGNYLLSVAEEMGAALIRSAYSSNIKERKDCSTAVFDPEGRMVAQAEHIPMHLGSMLGIIGGILAKYGSEIEPGDMFIANDPYEGGGTHLPDITIAAPVFAGERLIGWVANIAHHSDVGGMIPGSTSSDATSIFQEGIRIPVIRLASRGKIDDDLIDFILANCRTPDERRGDLKAQIAANHLGLRRVGEAYRKYGERLLASMTELQLYTERKLRAGIAAIPDGVYESVDYLDDDGHTSKPVKIAVRIEVRGDFMTLDFSGSDPQVSGPINVTYNGLLATVFYSLKAIIDPNIPSNQGIYKAFSVIAPEGSICNCVKPAPVGGRIDTTMRIADTIFGALAKALPDRAIAGCNSACTSATFAGIDPRSGAFFVYLETIAGGMGASRLKDGLSGVQVHMTNTSNLPVEALEMEYPLMVSRYALAKDTGGAGRTRGGLGIVREIRVLADDLTFSGMGDRQVFPPWGLLGGKDGAKGAFYHVSGEKIDKLPSKCSSIPLKKGDLIRIHTPGAGGYGDPRERDPTKIAADLIEGKVSAEGAAESYGVAGKAGNGAS